MNDEVHKANTENLVSIIIATFNAGKYLGACLSSIERYAPNNTEVIVIDACSTDNTIELLKKEHSFKLAWISEPDNGIYDALNKGASKANGTWLYFLGADDRLLPGFTELSKILADSNTVYYANSLDNFGDRENRFPLLKGAFNKYRLAKFCMNHQSILYPATVFKKYKYNLSYRISADYVLNMQVWGDPEFKKKFYPLTIVSYDMNGVSSFTKDEEFRKDKQQLVKKHLGWFIYARYRLKKIKENRKGNFEI